MFRLLSRIALLFLTVGAGTWVLNLAGDLVSAPDSMSVVAGMAVFAFALVFGGWAVWNISKSIYHAWESFKHPSTGGTLAGMLILGLVAMNTSGCTTISPGHVGIKVSNYGSDRGVQSYTLATGVVWYMPGASTVFEYPTFVQTVKWTASKDEGSPLNEEFTFNSKDAAVINADVSLSYQLDAAKVPHFYVKFRSDDLEGFTNGYLHNVARDAFQEAAVNYTALELYGDKKDEFLKAVRSRIAVAVDSLGVSITQFGLLGNLRLPPQITDAVNSKIAATQNAQRAQNEVVQAQAEAQKAVAKAQGESQANLLLTRSLTPELIQWRQLDIQQSALQKWNGSLPTYNGGGVLPFIQLQK